MTKITELTHIEAREFFLKEETYSSIELPEYCTFKKLLDKVSEEIGNNPIGAFYDSKEKPFKHDKVNYLFIESKDGE